MWFRRKVQAGERLGRTLGFPTLNCRVGSLQYQFKDGVYACEVRVDQKVYQGALHLGPKLGKRRRVLEIHLLNFSKSIYGKYIKIKFGKKIRDLKQFTDLELLKAQIKKDLSSI